MAKDKRKYRKVSDQRKHLQMLDALSMHWQFQRTRKGKKYPLELRDFDAAGVKWHWVAGPAFFRAVDESRSLMFTLRVERFDRDHYSADYWTLMVEGLGKLDGLDARHAPEEQYFGMLSTALDLVVDYREAAWDTRGKRDAVERIRAHIDALYKRGPGRRAFGERIKDYDGDGDNDNENER